MRSDGHPFILTAPLTEIIDNPGFFIQMGMASMPGWLEGIFNRKYPQWKDVPMNEDGSCASAPAGLRVLEEVLNKEFGADSCIIAHPDDVDRFIGPATRVVAISTHNPLGVTFAAGVYASMFGSSKNPRSSTRAMRSCDSASVSSRPNRKSTR